MRIAVIAALPLALALGLHDGAPVQAQEAPASDGVFTRYAVAADHPLASAAGAEMLAKGGNAVDAAAATGFALSVTRPFSCGLGGGGFMVIHLHEHPKVKVPAEGLEAAINFRETSPAGVGPDDFEKLGEEAAEASRYGGKSVAAPGLVAGLLGALEQYGTLDRATVLAPAIKLAREGFAVDAAYEKAAHDAIVKFEKHPGWKKRFAFTWDRFLGSGAIKAGDILKLPEQADALELIAKDGAKAFYQGPIGAAIVAAVKADGGALTGEDLKAFSAPTVEPLRFAFEGRRFVAMPPPSSGGVAMGETLSIFAKTPYREQIAAGWSAAYVQFLVEATKHAFADRAQWLGDPSFVDVPVARLLSPEYAAERAAGIRTRQTHGPESYGTRDGPPKDAPPDGGTSHFSIVDGAGNAVACTETINLEFGSLLSACGFCLNDEMDDFTTRRGEPNEFGLVQSARNLPAPGKRPLSSMSPTLVLDARGEIEAACGASGGPRIITATTQTLLNALLFGYDAGKAVGAPRFHHQWTPNVLEMEAGFNEVRYQGVRLSDMMRKQRHEVAMATRGAAVQLVLKWKDGTLHAASDPRKGGAPAGQ